MNENEVRKIVREEISDSMKGGDDGPFAKFVYSTNANLANHERSRGEHERRIAALEGQLAPAQPARSTREPLTTDGCPEPDDETLADLLEEIADEFPFDGKRRWIKLAEKRLRAPPPAREKDGEAPSIAQQAAPSEAGVPSVEEVARGLFEAYHGDRNRGFDAELWHTLPSEMQGGYRAEARYAIELLASRGARGTEDDRSRKSNELVQRAKPLIEALWAGSPTKPADSRMWLEAWTEHMKGHLSTCGYVQFDGMRVAMTGECLCPGDATPKATDFDDMEGRGPCGGSRCFLSHARDGVWIHSSKSYGTCSVRRAPVTPPATEGAPKAYDKAFGDDRVCKCGHPYYRHFDTYEGMRPVGCKYCDCECWTAPVEPQPAPDSGEVERVAEDLHEAFWEGGPSSRRWAHTAPDDREHWMRVARRSLTLRPRAPERDAAGPEPDDDGLADLLEEIADEFPFDGKRKWIMLGASRIRSRSTPPSDRDAALERDSVLEEAMQECDTEIERARECAEDSAFASAPTGAWIDAAQRIKRRIRALKSRSEAKGTQT